MGAIGRRQLLTGMGGLVGLGVLGSRGTAAQAAARRPPGTVLWRLPVGTPISLVANGEVVCAGIDSQQGGSISALAVHASTGQKAWSIPGSTLFAPFAAGPDAVFAVGEIDVTAVSAVTGHKLWTASDVIPAPFAGQGSGAPWLQYANGNVYTISLDRSETFVNIVVAIDSRTGQRRWAVRYEEAVTTFTVAAGVVYAGMSDNSSSRVVALDAATGKQRWTQSTAFVPSMMAFTAGVLICGAQNSPGPHGTFALDGATGRELWRRVPDVLYPVLASGGHYYAAFNSLMALNAVTGKQVWESGVEPTVLAADDDALYVGTQDKLLALSAANGRELWSHPTTEVGALAIADGAIFALTSASAYGTGTGSGSELYALQL
jgi:outer membrane protein assembly factor BamB